MVQQVPVTSGAEWSLNNDAGMMDLPVRLEWLISSLEVRVLDELVEYYAESIL